VIFTVMGWFAIAVPDVLRAIPWYFIDCGACALIVPATNRQNNFCRIAFFMFPFFS
jgi:hypothetical protein